MTAVVRDKAPVTVPQQSERGSSRDHLWLSGRGPAARPCLQPRAPFQAGFGPVLGCSVVFLHGRNSRRERDPRLLRCGKDVDVRRQTVGLVERADANE